MSIFDKDLIENEEIINRIKQWEVLFELTRKAQKKTSKRRLDIRPIVKITQRV